MFQKSFTLVGLMLALLLAVSCNRNQNKGPVEFNPQFEEYISGYSSGLISVYSPIEVRFRKPLEIKAEFDTEVDRRWFKISPNVEGKLILKNANTLAFVPSKAMDPDTEYDIKVQMEKLFAMPEGLEEFHFRVHTLKQSFSVFTNGLHSYGSEAPKLYKLSGEMRFADVIKLDEVKALLSASLVEKGLAIRWDSIDMGKVFPFTIDSIQRQKDAHYMLVQWSGESLKLDEVHGVDSIEVPAMDDFKVLDVQVRQSPEQVVLIHFSDPLDPKQDLDGIIRMGLNVPCRFTIEDNIVKAYPKIRQNGETTLTINKGVRNIFRYKLKETFYQSYSFAELKPAVQFIGEGHILPNSKGLIVPFKAVNLRAVDVQVVKIYEDNVPQFFQENTYSGENNIKRVGIPVVYKRISLENGKPLDLKQWNAFSLDLTHLVKQEPGAIYELTFSFRQEYSNYNCGGAEDTERELLDDKDLMEDLDMSNWDYDHYDDWDYYYPDGYEWGHKDNPCHVSYYTKRRQVKKNILASNIGIIAKMGESKKVNVYITDILSTKPLQGTKVKVLDFQLQTIGEAVTDAKGMASIQSKRTPFLIIAEKAQDRGYIRMNYGAAMSTSIFDVDGAVVQEGIKGYIYGERGVWRPGDTLFLTFVLQDEENRIPKDHPIEFSLKNTRGQIVKRITSKKNDIGFYPFICKTNPSDQTGYWSAKVKVGGATFTKGIRIETVKPNRLKIQLDFEDDLLLKDKDNNAELFVKWLHGATASELKADVSMHLSVGKTDFKNYKAYTFTDHHRAFYESDKMIYEGKVDKEGKAILPIQIEYNGKAPGMLKASFLLKAYEGGGDFSTHYVSKTFSPYHDYVGLRLPEADGYNTYSTDKSQRGHVVVLDPKGKPQKNAEVKVRMYKLQWRWWWNVSENNLASYISRNYNSLIFDKTITTNSKGKAQFNYKVDYPEWGRYIIQVESPDGHTVSEVIYFDWPEWRGRAQRGRSEGAAILTFSADKAKYMVGEMAEISFPSSGIGRALVSIENGSEVIDAMWVEPEEGEKETKVSIPITGEMAPNCFVHISLVQPHAQTANDLPIRLYGVTPLVVEDPQTRLDPIISIPKELAPEKEFIVKVSEKNNRPMTYTLAIVDEGLLDLTSFRTPNPWDVFYAREALGVRTWDMYNDVLGAYSGKMEKSFAIGGDAALNEKGVKKAQRFKPVVIYKGPFTLKGGTDVHKLKMPNYIGSVRAMVIAGDGTAYGNTAATVPVKSPVMVLSTVPRVVGPGETIKVPVTVFAENGIKKVQVKVSSNKMLKVQGKASKTVTFKKAGDKIIFFEMKASEAMGIAKVKVVASSGKHRMSNETELDVRPANPYQTDHDDYIMKAGAKKTIAYSTKGIKGSNDAYLELSFIPPIDMKRRLKYLIRYPYGCSEQVTSAAFPQLFVKSVMEVDDKFAAQLEINVNGGIQELVRRQNSDGGFLYWPSNTYSDEWVSSYVGHFLLMAKASGYYVRPGVLKQWRYYQRRMAREWRVTSGQTWRYTSSTRTQAYRLYTLALYGSPQMGEMNRLREKSRLDATTKYLLAAAYALSGNESAAYELIANYKVTWENYKSQDYSTYGSSSRDKAIVLLAANEMQNFELAANLVKDLANDMNQQYWMSTQTTAFCLLAISEFANGNDLSASKMQLRYQQDGGAWKTFSSGQAFAELHVEASPKKQHKLVIENKSKALLYTRLVREGIPVAGEEEASASQLKINVNYYDMDGRKIDVTKLAQGTNFVAEVQVSNPNPNKFRSNLALTEIFPSGWEIINTRMAGFNNGSTSAADYTDIRDDRVHYHFGLGSKRLTFRIQLNAAYAGKYYLPAVKCEAMYDNTIYAYTKGMWVQVLKE